MKRRALSKHWKTKRVFGNTWYILAAEVWNNRQPPKRRRIVVWFPDFTISPKLSSLGVDWVSALPQKQPNISSKKKLNIRQS